MPREIDEKDLTELRELEKKSAELRDELAEAVIREENRKSQIEELKEQLSAAQARKADVLDEIQDINEEGRELARDLRKKYGEGQFDLESGEFIEQTSD